MPAPGFRRDARDTVHLVPRLTAVYLDFQEQSCYRVWRWLSLLPERSSVEIRPFSVDAGRSWDRRAGTSGLELLALGEFARETGRAAHEAFIDAAFAAVHEAGGELTTTETWLWLGSAAGLDLEAFTVDGERWRAEVGLWHAEAEDELAVHEVPVLVFDDTHALFVQLAEDIVEAPAARRLLEGITDLVDQPIAAVRRTT